MSISNSIANKPLQKLVSFTEHDFDVMRNELNDGWIIVSLMANGPRYIGVIEQVDKNKEDSDKVFIPPRKKIKIIA